jgi:UDP-4-amino-4,6-dideoxy-N-acetyl-beta-L-altrosamine N-acetyltransferase
MINFRRVTEDDLEMILRWRTKPEVTCFMDTDIDFDLEKQLRWFEDVVSKKIPPEHWIILQDDRPIGLLYLADYDYQLHQTSWGFYIGEMGSWLVGGVVPIYFYNYMFFQRDLSLKKIVGHVFNLNSKVLELHRFHGCLEVGLLKDHITKYGKTYDITLVEMSRNGWLAQQDRFSKFKANFEE